MKYLLFSIALMLSACSSRYTRLHSVDVSTTCIDQFQPRGLSTSWYTAYVDVIGKHISGLLFIKTTDDQTTRLVFANETGLTFFDFEFRLDGTFSVKNVIPQLNRKPVIKTLRKDFETLLGIPYRNVSLRAWSADSLLYIGAIKGNTRYYFVTDAACATLKRLEIGSTRKPLVNIAIEGPDKKLPDHVVIHHENFNMTITLDKLIRDAAE